MTPDGVKSLKIIIEQEKEIKDSSPLKGYDEVRGG